MACEERNVTLKIFEKTHSKSWSFMKYAHQELFVNGKNTTGKKNVNTLWSLNQVETINHYKVDMGEFNDMPKIDFVFTLKDGRVVSGMVKDTMPCDCCSIWKGSANVKDE